MTGKEPATLNSSTKSDRCVSSSSSKTFSAELSSAFKNFCISGNRSPRNMCSVRQRPTPSAPNAKAVAKSFSVSALASTPMRSPRISSAQSRSFSNSGIFSDAVTSLKPEKTSPLVPSKETGSPSLIFTPPNMT